MSFLNVLKGKKLSTSIFNRTGPSTPIALHTRLNNQLGYMQMIRDKTKLAKSRIDMTSSSKSSLNTFVNLLHTRLVEVTNLQFLPQQLN